MREKLNKLNNMIEMKNLEGLFEIRNLNELKRFNIRLTLHDQNVSSHSLFVAIIANYIAHDFEKLEIFDIKNRYRVLISALTHDFEECKLGDILIPSKSNFKSKYEEESKKIKEELFKKLNIENFDFELNEIEKNIIEFSDKLEGFIYCVEEVEFGNSQFEEFAKSYYSRLIKIISKFEDKKIRKYLINFLNEIVFQISLKKNLKNFVKELEFFEGELNKLNDKLNEI